MGDNGTAAGTAAWGRTLKVLMDVGYVVFALVTAAANLWAAWNDVARTPMATANATRVGAPASWLLPLGALKTAGALGLVIGIAVPVIGVAAALGLVAFFVCAVGAHLRVRWYATIPFPAGFLLLAVGALVFRLGSM